MRLTFEMDLLAADTRTRTVEGIVVPYGEVARVGFRRYRVEPGAAHTARARTPLLLDHDVGSPIGVLAELQDTDRGAFGRFRVDRTPAGDEALAQAASGSRGAFSVGADVEAVGALEGDPDDDDTVVPVLSLGVVEVSLVALGAFAGATVEHVAAAAQPSSPAEPHRPIAGLDTPTREGTMSTIETPPAAADPVADLRAELIRSGWTPAPAPDPAADPPMILADRSPAPATLTAGEWVVTSIRAERGDREAMRIMAQIDPIVTGDLTGLLPPTYERDVLGGRTVDRVLFGVFTGRPLPPVGIAVQKPVWGTLPRGAWATSLDAPATTSKAVITLQPAAIERWDWATAISYIAAQRSSPDAIDTMYGEAVIDFYGGVEQKIATALAGGPAGTSVFLGDGIAEFYSKVQRSPEVIIVAPDIWGLLADARRIDAPLALGDSLSAVGGLVGSFGGLTIVGSAHVPTGAKILATRRALDVRTSNPVRLTVQVVGALSIELGVVGEGLFDRDVPNEILRLAAGSPIPDPTPPPRSAK